MVAVHTPAGEVDRLTLGALIRLRAAFTISSIGDWIYRFAVPVLVLRLTGSPLATALTYVVELVPYVVIGPFAGLVADRFPRRTVMILCDSASAIVAALLALLARANHPPIAALYTIALLLACIRPFYFPALQGLTVEGVPEERRAGFNAWTQVTDGLLSFSGPVFGTAIVAAAGTGTATLINAATFAASATLLASIAPGATRRARPRPPTSSSGIRRGLAVGLRTIGYSPAILWGTVLMTAANFAASLIEGNLVYVLLHSEGQSKVALGMVFSAQGAGAVVAGVLAPRLMKRTSAGLVISAGMALSVVGMAIPAVLPIWGAIVAGAGIGGAAFALVVVCWFTSLQRIIPAERIGRFVAMGRAIAYATLPAGAVLGAVLLNASGSVRALFTVAATIQLLVAIGTVRSPVTRIAAADTAPSRY
ncbi:MAG TPA: MFS transporter [Actinocrinis sp.]|uniref:MFS transporter n=1 Tax=Actinocrinis sp. TaxID=1920516 RepID=UPI002DDD53DF|nr:MFS transporter [Actinocrinis sp.]HEV2347091.1 MFS transporter [Actinocrinis sp.]